MPTNIVDSQAATAITMTLPPQMQPLLDSLTGETPDQKIAHLFVSEVRCKLEACEQERLDLEIKYGMEYAEFKEQLEAGALGEEFGYELEMDAMRWDDLITEKQHWLQQLRLAKDLFQ
jgi:hypothetical protein